MPGTLTLVAAATPARPPHRPNHLLRAGLVAGPLFVASFLLQTVFRDDGYDALRHPVSSLALGPAGWVQTVTFLVAGVLTVAFAAGLRRSLGSGPGAVAGPLLIAVWGVCLAGAGVFVTDPVSGYPAGTPPVPDRPSRHGLLHDMLFALPGFLAFAAAMLVFAYAFARRRAPGWALCSGLSGAAFLVLFLLASAGFAQHSPWVSSAGLLQRLTVGVGWLWLTALAVRRSAVDRAGG